jgi:putative holliday junction resolvase
VRRILGADLGERRIGLAVADRDGGRAIALTTLKRSTPALEAAAIARIASEQGADELVVGLPLHASGEEGSQAAITRAWIAELEPLVGLTITVRDERLTSHLAEQRLGPMKRGRSGGPPSKTQRDAYRGRVDREAAAIILQDELDSRSASSATKATDASSANQASGGARIDDDMENAR